MSSLLTSQGMALATAMAVSGTVIIFALCRPKPLFDARFAVHHDSPSAARNLRSCIASGERNMRRWKKKKKRVHFADHLVEAVKLIAYEDKNEEEEEEEEGQGYENEDGEYETGSGFEGVRISRKDQGGRMPANRLALYNGILQDRLQRMTCSY
ncbi:hypothetical protein H6P81_010387 [Aristolochia fimbriata]|uniref:Uncharacterized protein n=1 Tax=Aristolochia fimbriata TaxID=158543 RepID=A0AAV7ERY7_ARIFI|nr:hypothetical protein H6P81_010387 [Aristolochia fimbriata]